MKIPTSVPWESTGQSLGQGGQAEVFLVTKRGEPSSKLFALKALKNSTSVQARQRFLREIAAVKTIDSPFIAKIVDHSQVDDTFQYYTMDYYEGARTLASVIRERPNPYHGNVLKCLDTLKFLVLAVRSCELSKPQIIHRDINPKNILILPDGSLRLIDFGICQFDDGHLITLTDENVGTRDFTAPECEAGNEAEIGLHSDLYSVGKVLWSMVTSQRGFAREKPVFGIKSMKSVLPDIPNACHLDRIFFRTIRSNIKNRISKTEELLNLIQETRYLVEAGFPNIYEINQRCPSCGYPAVKQFEGGHNVFGNPNPENVHSVICGRCGFGFVRNISFLRDELQQFLEAD